MNKDFDKLFTIKDGELLLNKHDLRMIPEFKLMFAMDKGREGDFDARKKTHSFTFIKFMYFYYHPMSAFVDMPDEKRKIRSMVASDLRGVKGEPWVINKYEAPVLKVYLELIEIDALFKTYINARRSVYNMGEDIEFFNKLREVNKKKIMTYTEQLEKASGEEELGLQQSVEAATVALMNSGNQILTITNNLAKAYDVIKVLKTKLLEANNEGSALKGGGDLGNRER